MRHETIRPAWALALGAILVLGALVFAPSAGAAVGCNFTTDQVNIQMTAPGDVAKLEIGGGGTILVDDATGPIICGPAGPPTVTNTQTVAIADTSDIPGTPAPMDGSTRVEIAEPSTFVPGATLTGENGGLGEIEFNLYPNEGNDDTLLLVGANPGVDDWALGTAGVDWNAGANDPAPDPEVSAVSEIDRWSLAPRGGSDRIRAQGGSGTGAPFLGKLDVSGDGGDDLIEGGDEFDRLSGGSGNDVVRAFGDDDQLYDGAGDDVLDGGPGGDFLDYYGLPTGVTVDLSRVGPQDTGAGGIDAIAGIEEVNGTEHADILSGNAEFNYLYGNEGDDVLDGGPGDDAITGGAGSDTVTYAQAPTGVSVDLSASAGSGYGNDGIADVENVIGSRFADRLTGSDAANAITGLAGEDAVSALAGADVVDVRDRERDTVSCGSEADTVTADRLSLDVIEPDCETVRAEDEPANELTFELSGKPRQRIVKRRHVAVIASCPLEDCTVTVRAKGRLPRSPGTERMKVLTKPVTVALAAGVPEEIRLRLKHRQVKAVKAVLATGKNPKLAVNAQAVNAAAGVAVASLTVRARR